MAFFTEDDIAGFDPYQVERLLKPFPRLHATSDFRETGPSLAAVQRIIARHGGKVWAERPVQKSAAFDFLLRCGCRFSRAAKGLNCAGLIGFYFEHPGQFRHL